jgi:hypothetical protein
MIFGKYEERRDAGQQQLREERSERGGDKTSSERTSPSEVSH